MKKKFYYIGPKKSIRNNKTVVYLFSYTFFIFYNLNEQKRAKRRRIVKSEPREEYVICLTYI